MEIEKCLDERNRDFYKENVASKLRVRLLPSDVDSNTWTAKYRDGDTEVFIIAGNDYPNIESFTHEMLHLYLFANSFSTFGITAFAFFDKLKRNLVLPQVTLDGIFNAIAHYKMLPIFTKDLKMDKAKFLANAGKLVMESDIKLLESSFHSDIEGLPYHFTNFIRFFFDIRYHFSKELEQRYREYQERIRAIDDRLYKILDTNCSMWESDIKSYDNTVFFNSLYADLDDYL